MGKVNVKPDFTHITIDTNVFLRNGFDYSGSRLKNFKQFFNTRKFVISSLVLREARKHHLGSSKKICEEISTKFNKPLIGQMLPEEIKRDISKCLDNFDFATAVDRGCDDFVAQSGAIVVEADADKLNEILDAYFDTKPPFSNKKKSEFPDALILHSIEGWAEKNNAHVLAVSVDGDWSEYCETSERITCVNDLDKALESMQQDIVKAEQKANLFLEKLVNEKDSSFVCDINRMLQSELDVMNIDFLVDWSGGYCDAHVPELKLENSNFRKVENQFAFRVLEFDQLELSLKVIVDVFFSASTQAELYIYDSADGDEIHLASVDVSKESKAQAHAVLSFDTDEVGREINYEVLSLEIFLPEIDFGSVSPFEDDEH